MVQGFFLLKHSQYGYDECKSSITRFSMYFIFDVPYVYGLLFNKFTISMSINST